MAKFKDLYEFVDSAVKNRKYAPNTAHGIRTALKLFELEINEEEKDSLDKFKENFEQVFRGVTLKNKNMTAGSLLSYKSRIKRLLEQYENYGSDAVKMNNWSVKAVVRQKKEESAPNKKIASQSEGKDISEEVDSDTSKNFIFPFAGGIKLIIPTTPITSDAIADGELKSVRQALSKFADTFMKESKDESES